MHYQPTSGEPGAAPCAVLGDAHRTSLVGEVQGKRRAEWKGGGMTEAGRGGAR